MTWILGSIDPLIVLNLRPYKTAKAMLDYLQKVYNQDHSARRFQLEHEIAMYSQGGLSVQDYFSGFQNLWAEFTDIVYAKILSESLSIIQRVHEQSKRDQFLMKLRSDFENVRSNLMNRDPSPSLDVCFRELFREEQCLFTQMLFIKEMLSLSLLQLKVKERAWIWLDFNDTVAKNMIILLAIVAKSSVIIVNNKDTLSKSVPHVLKIVGQMLFKLG
uniref:Retrotransposon gag domain-containing protein n=1 Tax=Solanum tuberosum TaxID=4113 RepID=M1B9Y0_SOLTU